MRLTSQNSGKQHVFATIPEKWPTFALLYVPILCDFFPESTPLFPRLFHRSAGRLDKSKFNLELPK